MGTGFFRRLRYLLLLIHIGFIGGAGAQAPGEGATPGVRFGTDPDLSAGAAALQRGRYDEGLRLTQRALDNGLPDTRARSAAHANLCSAYVMLERPDDAIPHCDEALRLNSRSWQAYSTRARAWLLKDRLFRARLDNDAAAALNPNADHVQMIAGMLNEMELKPRIVIEDHQ